MESEPSTGVTMNLFARLHFLHRAWRYRLRSEKFGMSFLLSRDLARKTAVDIGAHWGIYAYWMHKKVGPEGRVVAFEPQPELSAHLAQLRDCFRLDRLENAQLGLSSVIAERQLARPKAHWGGASLEDLSCDVDWITIQVTTLDRYFGNHDARPVSFIKCDVERHEYDVFRGGATILKEDRPDLLFECHDAGKPECKVFSYLNGLDYEGFCFFRNGFAPVSEYRSIRHLMHKKALVDFVFVPKERSAALTRR
jgi:FkbM family methyltransferase